MDQLCGLLGKSKQAYYQRQKYEYKQEAKADILLQCIEKERKKMPRLGGKKLRIRIKPNLPKVLQFGRDKFFRFLREEDLLVRKRKYRVRTTYSYHRYHKYPNLTKELIPDGPHQLWVSDITYIKTSEGSSFLSLVTDAYSRKIIGWMLGLTLEAKHTIKALQMAINQLPKGVNNVIHHSDRGVQYCCDDYVKLLEKHHCKISMTENGDPRENAIAERVNGILKDEWLNQIMLKSSEETNKQLKQIISAYNHDRPHGSLDMQTPDHAHYQSGTLKKHWKNYYKINKNDKQEKLSNSFV